MSSKLFPQFKQKKGTPFGVPARPLMFKLNISKSFKLIFIKLTELVSMHLHCLSWPELIRSHPHLVIFGS